MTAFAADPATLWMRDAAALAAECLVRMPPDSPIRPRDCFEEFSPERWQALRERARKRETEGWPTGLIGLDFWLAAAAAAAELHPDAAAAFSILAEHERLALPTPATFARIAVSGLAVSYEDALAAAMRAADAGLIERVEPPGAGQPLAHCGVRLKADAVGLLFGAEAASTAELEPPALKPIFAREAAAAAILLRDHNAVWVRAPSRRLGRHFAHDIATHRRVAAAFLTLRDGKAPQGLERIAGLPVLDLFDLDQPPQGLALPRAPVAIVAPMRFEHAGFRAIDAPEIGPQESERIWDNAPLPRKDRLSLSQRFRLTLPELRAALAEAETAALLSTGAKPASLNAKTVSAAVRAEGARHMGRAVTLVRTGVSLQDLVATPEMLSQIEDAVAWRRNSARVWGEMGLPLDGADAKGLSLLFSGPPGGGKTFAARCLANALDLNLYRIDLSQVVSKYIGETEKALARVFDEAEAGHGLLFFDEADAIFGKRSEVKDAHDRYANIEVGFLLQRMESFDGVMVLATNLRANLDPAFTRRIRFIIDFPVPGAAERQILWRRNLPDGKWLDAGLDIGMLAERFRLSGGSIRNAATAAAHLAAGTRAPVGPRHVARALYRELEKAGLPRAAADLGPLAAFLEASP